MVVGQIGEPGAVPVSRVVVACKDAHDLVPTLLRGMVALIVREIIYIPKLAISTDAQATYV